MTRLVVDTRYQALLADLGWNSSGRVLREFIPAEAALPNKVLVAPKTVLAPGHEPLAIFFKCYSFPSPNWRFWMRPSKAQREFENYAVFEKLGIQCPHRVAWGETRDGLGRLRYAFIVTRAVRDAVTLLEFARTPGSNSLSAGNRQTRIGLSDELAAMVRRLHAGHFFHNDLYWRNVLVEWGADRAPRLWWLDCPRGKFRSWSPWRRRWQIKDLAALDVAASALCSRSERVRFIKDYLNAKKLDARSKALIRDVEGYRLRRWPSPSHHANHA